LGVLGATNGGTVLIILQKGLAQRFQASMADSIATWKSTLPETRGGRLEDPLVKTKISLSSKEERKTVDELFAGYLDLGSSVDGVDDRIVKDVSELQARCRQVVASEQVVDRVELGGRK
jgi:hypothetical protein